MSAILALRVNRDTALSAGVLASILCDGTAHEEFIAAVMGGPYQRRQLTSEAELVNMGHGHVFIVARRKEGLAVLTLIEAQLAGLGADLDVYERVEPVVN